MKNLDFFVLRSSLLSYEESTDLFERLINGEELEYILREKFQNPILQEAIFVASPIVYEQMLKLLSQELESKDVDPLCETLLKYLLRATGRATPYGLFGCSAVGKFEVRGNYIFGSEIRRNAKLDISVINLITNIVQNSSLKEGLRYSVNNTLYAIGEDFRYTEYQGKVEEVGYFRFVGVKANKILSHLLKKCTSLTKYTELVDFIVELGYSVLDAREYIDSLIQEQVLLSELVFSSNNTDQLEVLTSALRRCGDDFIHGIVIKIKEQLDRVNEGKLSSYKMVLNGLNELNFKFDKNRFLHVCSFRSSNVNLTISNAVKKDLIEAIGICSRLDFERESQLEDLKTQFVRRFENQTVPLLLLFDPDFGISFSKSFDAELKESDSKNRQLMQRFSILEETIKNDSEYFDLAKMFNTDSAKLADSIDSFSVIAELYEGKPEAIVFLKQVSYGSSANLLTRFATGDDEIREKARSLIVEEEVAHENVIHAEIDHLPQSRAGNVAIRPPLRSYEIPIYSIGSQSLKVIRLDDLFVRVVDGRFLLISNSLNSEVIPHLTTAHNHRQDESHPMYRFLGELNHQSSQRFRFWDWGIYSTNRSLPRICFNSVIISPLTWNLLKKDWDWSFKSIGEFDRLRLENRIKDRVLLVDMDNLLPLDLRVPSCVQLLQRYLSKNGSVRLFEDYNHLWGPKFISDKNKRHVCEVIIPFARQAEVVKKLNHGVASNVQLAKIRKQFFFPGSEWLYFKLYLGKSSSDVILRKFYTKLIKKYQGLGQIDSWFFIRYTDPEYHLRIRLKLKRKEHLGSIISDFSELSYGLGKIWRFQVDTYQREFDRYGGLDAIPDAELFFHIESEFLMDLYARLKETSNSDFFLIAGIFWINKLVSICLIDSKFKESFFDTARDNQLLIIGRTNDQSRINKNLDKEFRKLRGNIDSVITDQFKHDNRILKIRECANSFFDRVLSEIKGFERNELNISRLNSFIHMFVNRLFREDQLYEEYRIYYFLSKYYYSINKRYRNV